MCSSCNSRVNVWIGSEEDRDRRTDVDSIGCNEFALFDERREKKTSSRNSVFLTTYFFLFDLKEIEFYVCNILKQNKINVKIELEMDVLQK